MDAKEFRSLDLIFLKLILSLRLGFHPRVLYLLVRLLVEGFNDAFEDKNNHEHKMLDQDDQDEESHLIPVIIMISNQILVGSSITSLESLSNVQISVLIFLL